MTWPTIPYTYTHKPHSCFMWGNLCWSEVHVLGSHLVDSVHCLQTHPLLNVMATAVQSSCRDRWQEIPEQYTIFDLLPLQWLTASNHPLSTLCNNAIPIYWVAGKLSKTMMASSCVTATDFQATLRQIRRFVPCTVTQVSIPLWPPPWTILDKECFP